jgi:hypothetical protein
MLLSLILSLILHLCTPQHTKEYNNLQPFHQITINGSFKTKIEQGNKYSVLVVGNEKVVEQLFSAGFRQKISAKYAKRY